MTTRRGFLSALALTPLASRAANALDAGSFFALNTGDLRAELTDARAQGRNALMLFFEQEGCPGCRHMKQAVFNRQDVQEYFGQHFVSFAVDTSGSIALTDFTGRELTEKAYANGIKIKTTPTFVFYDLNGIEIVRLSGPVRTPQEFLLLGHFVTSGAYKTRSFAQFKADPTTRKGNF